MPPTEIVTSYPLPPRFPGDGIGMMEEVQIETLKRLCMIEERLSRIEAQLAKQQPTT